MLAAKPSAWVARTCASTRSGSTGQPLGAGQSVKPWRPPVGPPDRLQTTLVDRFAGLVKERHSDVPLAEARRRVALVLEHLRQGKSPLLDQAGSADTGEHARQLLRFGYREFEVDPQMVLTIPAEWTSFDDYLASLT